MAGRVNSVLDETPGCVGHNKKEHMDAFDGLPKAVREALCDVSVDYCSVACAELIRAGWGPLDAVKQFKKYDRTGNLMAVK